MAAAAARTVVGSPKVSAAALGSPHAAGSLSFDVAGQQQQQQDTPGVPGSSTSSSRLYKSAEWATPLKTPGSSVRKSLVSAIDPLTAGVGHRSFNSLMLTPMSAQGGLRVSPIVGRHDDDDALHQAF